MNVSGNITTSGSGSQGSESPKDIQIGLTDLLKNAKTEIDCAFAESRMRLIVITTICGVLLCLCVMLGYEFYTYDDYPATWTWQMIYFTSVRICIVTAVFGVLTFCFSVLRSYIHLYQRNSHRKTIINIMPALFSAGTPYMEKHIIYKQLVDILINYDQSGILKEEAEFSIDKTTLELIKKLINKD